MNKKLWNIVLLLAVDLAMLILISSFIGANALHLGSSGERVAAVQNQLAEKDFFDGETDGLFSLKTRTALKNFQKNQGIEASGKTDYETLCALGINSRTGNCFTSEAMLLARCIELGDGITHYEMLSEGLKILETARGVNTLASYALEKYPDIANMTDEPPCDAFSAAVQAMKIFSEQSDSLF